MKEERLINFKPLTFNPAPFPGDDTEEQVCQDCDDTFTMAEFRVFSWQEHSDYCITCASKRIAARHSMTLGPDHTRKPTKMTLPYPPPVNHLYRSFIVYKNGKPIAKRASTQAAKDYKRDVAARCKEEGMPLYEGPVTVTLLVFRRQRRGDLDGVWKALLDALSGVAYHDDEQVDVQHAYRFEDKDDPRLIVTIEPTIWDDDE